MCLGCWIDAAKPSYQEEHGRKHKTPWTDHFIDELKRGLVACKIFLFFPIYWLVYGQMISNLVSQGMKFIPFPPSLPFLFLPPPLFLSGTKTSTPPPPIPLSLSLL